MDTLLKHMTVTPVEAFIILSNRYLLLRWNDTRKQNHQRHLIHPSSHTPPRLTFNALSLCYEKEKSI